MAGACRILAPAALAATVAVQLGAVAMVLLGVHARFGTLILFALQAPRHCLGTASGPCAASRLAIAHHRAGTPGDYGRFPFDYRRRARTDRPLGTVRRLSRVHRQSRQKEAHCSRTVTT